MKRTWSLLGLAILLGVQVSAATTPADEIIKVDGSSTVYPVTEAVAEEFQKKHKIKVTVGISGTGGGFKKFCRGETDVQDASRPILKKEQDDCKANKITYMEFPIGFDAITIAVSPKNTWLKSITVDEMKKLWEPSAAGKIMKWNQVRAEWPDAPIKLFGAGSDSGTFDYFTEAVVGTAKASRGDYTASEDDNTLVQGISSEKNALGYLPYAYYEANKTKLRLVPVDGGPNAPKKGPIAPSLETVVNATYYPLSRPIFIYVSASAANRSSIKDFTEFYLNQAEVLTQQVKYIPLPKKAYTTALDHFKKRKLGSVFKGESEVGLKIEELLKRESTL